jgi:hypothetical protein
MAMIDRQWSIGKEFRSFEYDQQGKERFRRRIARPP